MRAGISPLSLLRLPALKPLGAQALSPDAAARLIGGSSPPPIVLTVSAPGLKGDSLVLPVSTNVARDGVLASAVKYNGLMN